MKPWHTIQSTDIIAALMIAVACVNLFTTKDPTVTGTLTLISGYYFGKKASTLPPGGGSGSPPAVH